jgi:uncharacterized protein
MPPQPLPDAEPPRIWWKEPMVWLIAGLPLAAVVAGLATVMIAVHDPDSLVSEEHVKQGMAVVTPESAADARAAALGIAAEVSLKGGRVSVLLNGGLAPTPATLRLILIHPAQAEQDVTLTLELISGNAYLGGPLSMPAGKRRVVLEATDRAWRLTGEGTLSDAGMLLAARSSPSSTHP